MNSLNLRISAVKSGENVKKNSETRALKVLLPEQYVTSTDEHVETFRSAQNVPQQVNAVKQIFLSADENANVVRFLADLIFNSSLNHPVRNQIIKLFCKNASQQSEIVAALEASLAEQLRLVSASNDNQTWNDVIVSIGGCFNNFPSGLQALKAHLQEFLTLLHNAIQRCLSALTVTQSPSKLNEIHNFLHNSLRTVLSVMQEVTFVSDSYSSDLETITRICSHVSIRDDVPMETCVNGARIVAQIAHYFDGYEIFLTGVKKIQKLQELPLCISALNSFILQYFSKYPETFYIICTNTIQIGTANATKQNVLIYTSRGLYQYARNLQQLPHDCDAISLNFVKLSLSNMLSYAFAYLQHHIDTVRHMCRDLLKQIMFVALRFSFEQISAQIYEAINGTRMSLPARCIVLKQSVLVFGPQDVILSCKGLFNQIFNDHLGRDADVDSAYETLLIATFFTAAFKSWSQVWLDLLLEIAALQDERLTSAEKLITNAAILGPSVLSHVMKAPNLSASTKLSALCAVRKSGNESYNLNALLSEYSNDIRAAMMSANQAISLMALRVIVESHKTTEPLTKFDCENMNIYIEFHANCPDPDVRQKTYALLSKALVRCELTLSKEHKKRVDINEPLTDSLPLAFLRDIIHAMVANLFPGANYSRRWLALQLLQQCLSICKTLKFKYDKLMPKDSIGRIVDVLADSYEGNKAFAVNVLNQLEEQMPEDSCQLQELNFELEDIRKLLISLRPPDSVTGTYKLELFCTLSSTKPHYFGIDPIDAVVQHYPTIYAALKWCMRELVSGLEVAESDLQRAAKFNPLYGLLYAIRHLLKRLDTRLIAEEAGWRQFIKDLVVCSKQLTAVVAPVVNSSSPEGHLPNDFSELTCEFNQLKVVDRTDMPTSTSSTSATTTTTTESIDTVITDARILAGPLTPEILEMIKTTPQMVLLCSWRTVKEVSLILGELVLRSPLQYDDTTTDYLLTKAQLHEIGAHFKELLAETKHRGAFEQAYVGFCMYCIRLWRAEALELNALPPLWLNELLTMIASPEQPGNEKLCATRRSAGLPFMVQALVTSELQVGSSKALHSSIERLLDICKDRSTAHAESRTHALNIMRALFRCSELNESVGEYVASGVICALNSYEENTWPERNSASLLFAALMTRIFGVMRTKDTDNLNIRNRMTGRIFFTRYPELYDYFYNELRAACELVLAGGQAPKLYPMLLLLSRLYPSALEGAESNLNLANFIPLIAACSGVAELNTRCLTAKALCALVDKDVLDDLLRKKCAKLLYTVSQPERRHLNTLHGDLLQIEHLLKRYRLLNSALVNDVTSTINILARTCTLNNGMLMGTILDIMNLIMQQHVCLPHEPGSVTNFLIFYSEHYCKIIDECAQYCKIIRRSYQIYMLHVQRLTTEPASMVNFLLNPTIAERSMNPEILESTINIILLILFGRSASLSVSLDAADMEEFEFESIELQFIYTMPDDFRIKLTDQLYASESLLAQVLNMIEMERFYPEIAMKCYAMLSMLKPNVFTLSELLTQAVRFPSDAKSAITMCMVRLIKEHGIDISDWDMILAHALEIVDPALPNCVRTKATQLLAQLAPHFETVLKTRELQLIGSYVRLMLQLLADDSDDIRNYTSNIVTKNLKKTDTLPSFYAICTDDVVPTLAQQLFILSLTDMLKDMEADDAFLLDVFYVIVEPHLNTCEKVERAGSKVDDAKEGVDKEKSMQKSTTDMQKTKDETLLLDPEIFDRNEANVYGEPLKVVNDMLVVYRKCFADRQFVLEQLKDYVEHIKLQY